MEEDIDEDFHLYFKTKSGDIINVNDKLLDKLKKLDYSSLPQNVNVSLCSGPFFEISFKDESSIIINYIPINCKITISKSQKVISLYSYKHLKLILNKLKEEYTNPYFYSTFYSKTIFVNYNNLEEQDFCFEKDIEIKEKKKVEDIEKIKLIFGGIKKIYESKKNLTYEFISPNFKIYFPKIIPELKEKFNYIYSDHRKSLESNFRLFLEKDEKMIYPICGPHNIGKTITSMKIQKSYYLKGIKSLYLNLKYYFHEPFNDLDKKIDTLIKECVYFIENEEQLLILYNKFHNLNKIYDIISILPSFLKTKNFSKNQFFLIIDQYQEKYDSKNILELFSSFKIFLLSSINDSDVKKNLILTYQEKSLKTYKLIEEKQIKKIIRYTYYEYLFDFSYFNMIIFEKKIKDKIKEKEDLENKIEKKDAGNKVEKIDLENKVEDKEVEENKIEEKYKFISSILMQFNYIPKYSYGFINFYNTIYDLMFCEYKNIFLKLLQFKSNKTIEIYKINELLKDKNIVEKTDIEKCNYKTLSEEKYIEYLKYIPLKYINYHLNNIGELYFYYSFPLFKQILNDFIEYCKSKDNFFITTNGGEKGTYFEKIVKTQFRVFNSLKIDGHLEVKSIINMDFTENYKLLDKTYIKGKKNILITQKNDQGKDYDFAIYKPETHQLLLLQSKYQIDNNLINNKNTYKDSSRVVLNNLNRFIGGNEIEKVYLLYISSEEYNINRKMTVKNLLIKNQINCLFYSVEDENFSFDFEEKIDEIKCDDSFMILPDIKDYVAQDIKAEKKKSKKAPNSEDKIVFLKKKKKKSYNKDKIYESLKNYIVTKQIEFSIGKLIKIESFSDEQIEIDRKMEYIIIFSLKEEDDSIVDVTKPIGLIFYDNKRPFYLEVTKNLTYSKYEELFEIFSTQSYYGIGEKIKD